jgi:hypothetical protein
MLVQTTPGFCLGPAGWNRPRKGCRPLVEHLACAGSASSLSTDRSSFDLSPRHRYRLTRVESLAQPSVLSLSYAPIPCATRSGQCRRATAGHHAHTLSLSPYLVAPLLSASLSDARVPPKPRHRLSELLRRRPARPTTCCHPLPRRCPDPVHGAPARPS